MFVPHLCAGAPDVQVSDWRMNIFRAKKTAVRAVTTMAAFSAFKKQHGDYHSTQPRVQVCACTDL